MVRIIGFKERQKENGEKFFVLEVQGGIEMIQSKSTGNFYATAKKATVPSTFDEQTCLAILGTEMPGKITKQEVEPYSYVIKETGEEITLAHRYVYEPEEDKVYTPTQNLEANVEAFSKNGHLELADMSI